MQLWWSLLVQYILQMTLTADMHAGRISSSQVAMGHETVHVYQWRDKLFGTRNGNVDWYYWKNIAGIYNTVPRCEWSADSAIFPMTQKNFYFFFVAGRSALQFVFIWKSLGTNVAQCVVSLLH